MALPELSAQPASLSPSSSTYGTGPVLKYRAFLGIVGVVREMACSPNGKQQLDEMLEAALLGGASERTRLANYLSWRLTLAHTSTTRTFSEPTQEALFKFIATSLELPGNPPTCDDRNQVRKVVASFLSGDSADVGKKIELWLSGELSREATASVVEAVLDSQAKSPPDKKYPLGKAA